MRPSEFVNNNACIQQLYLLSESQKLDKESTNESSSELRLIQKEYRLIFQRGSNPSEKFIF